MRTTNSLLMDNSPELPDWELIEGYYGHTLSAADQKRAEHRFATDPAFRAEAEAWKEADLALRELAFYQVAKQTVQRESRKLRWKGQIRLGTTSFATICIIIGWFLFSPVDIQSYQQDMTVRRNSRSDSTTQQTILSERQKSFYKDFFEGQTYLADGQPTLAIPYFERVLNLPNLRPYFRQAVEWQLINAYLQAHQPNNAHTTYQRLMASDELTYPIRTLDRWRVQWQIGYQKLVY